MYDRNTMIRWGIFNFVLGASAIGLVAVTLSRTTKESRYQDFCADIKGEQEKLSAKVDKASQTCKESAQSCSEVYDSLKKERHEAR